MCNCIHCGKLSISDIILEDDRIPKMRNNDKIIAPRCRFCNNRFISNKIWNTNDKNQKVIVITGLCGSGKSSIGQMLEKQTGYIHIDGDAVSKRVNWDIKNGYLKNRSGYRVFDELLETIKVLLQLGHSVIATYVFSEEEMVRYKSTFIDIGINNHFFVLNTNKDICIQRDKSRTCWTAGEEFIMKWYDEQMTLVKNDSFTIIENSTDTLNDTVHKIFARYNSGHFSIKMPSGIRKKIQMSQKKTYLKKFSFLFLFNVPSFCHHSEFLLLRNAEFPPFLSILVLFKFENFVRILNLIGLKFYPT